MTTLMTDRELLEMAAKAAGRIVEGFSSSKGILVSVRDGVSAWWNPLATDGDALRLAVKLKIDTEFDDWNGKEIVTAASPENFTGWLEEDSLPDPYAATRRAIVCAAAQSGRAMP